MSDIITEQAHKDFDAWRAAHEDLVGELDLLDQIEIYSLDSAWHSRADADTGSQQERGQPDTEDLSKVMP